MGLIESLLCGLQYILPHHLLSRVVYGFMRIRWAPFRVPQIYLFGWLTGVDWSESRRQSAREFRHYNDFFTRELVDGARPLDPDPRTFLSPADGRVSQSGRIVQDQLLQAKGQHFTVNELLADDPASAEFYNGHFHTIYLSPRDYHRVHMPLHGKLNRTIHVPGRLFSVAPYTTRRLPRLYARNERVISFFDTEVGPVAQVLVGAMLVSSMETVWAGVITPPRGHHIARLDWSRRDIELDRGAEMGRFNMGSTVILLLPPGAVSKLVDTVLRFIDIARGGNLDHGAQSFLHATRQAPVRDLGAEGGKDRFEQRQVDHLPLAVPVAGAQRDQHRSRAVVAGDHVGQCHRRQDGRSVGKSVHRGETGQCFDQRSEAGPVAICPVLTPSGNAHHDQAGVGFLQVLQGARPIFSSVPGRKFSTSTSALSISFRSTSMPFGSADIPARGCACCGNRPSRRFQPPPPANGADRRRASGFSTLITSAPKSASLCVTILPATRREMSTMRRSLRGGCALMRRGRSDLGAGSRGKGTLSPSWPMANSPPEVL